MQLDPYQAMARDNLDEKVLLVAPPGSGKTTVLLAKIRYLMKELAVPPSAILVLTFSRSASQDMKARFTREQTGESPFFGTMHAFAYRQIKGEVSLMGPAHEGEALKDLCSRFGFTDQEAGRIISAISRQRSTGEADRGLPEGFRCQAKAAYDRYKKAQGISDFDDLEERLLHLLQDDGFRQKLSRRFQWVMVDEFQDLNRMQLTILKHLSRRAHLFCVGDEDQSIYAFRGSDTRAMTGFCDEFPGGKILYLRYNYRCSATVVRHAGALIRHNKERYPKEIVAFRQDESEVKILNVKDEACACQVTARELKKLPASETAAVLLRTNSELEETAHRLYREGVHFHFLDKSFRPYDRLPFSLILDHLEVAVTGGTAVDPFIRIARGGRLNLPSAALNRLRMSSHRTIHDLEMPAFGLALAQRQALFRFLAASRRLRTMKAGEGVRYVLYHMGVYETLRRSCGIVSWREMLSEGEEFARRADAYPDIARFLKDLKGPDKEEEGPEPILLSTLHGVKGMEFDRVFLLNAAEGRMPHERSMDDLEAERRLFYVAVTRARHGLTVLCPEQLEGKAVSPSRFALELGLPLMPQGQGPAHRRLLRQGGRPG